MSEDSDTPKSEVSMWTDRQPIGSSAGMNFSQHRVALDADGNSRLRLAQATREILQNAATSSAADEVFAEAAVLLERATQLLATAQHGRSYHGSAEGAVGGTPHGFISHSPVTGPLNALAPALELRTTGTEIIATVTYGDAYEGPPGCLHGGMIAAVFDEILGFAQALSGAPGMTGRLEVTYRSPTPLHEPLRIIGRFDGVLGRKIMTSGEIFAGDRLCAEAVGTFISVKMEKFAALSLERRQRAERPPE